MRQRTKTSLILVLFIITTLACSINNIEISEAPNYELTITAQALQLQQGGQAANPATVLETPTAASALVAVATPTTGGSGVIAAASTSTSSTVTVTVSAETNCRTGPSVNFSSKYSLPVGQVAEVIGKNTLTNYWIIKIPGSGSGSTCWLWGKYATVSGNVSSLVEIATPTPLASTNTSTATKVPTATVTATLVVPVSAAPSNIQVSNKTCSDLGNGKTRYTGTISWTDNASDEVAFAINLPGTSLTAGPNATSYNFSVDLFNVTYSMGQTIPGEITALSATTNSASQFTFSCQ